MADLSVGESGRSGLGAAHHPRQRGIGGTHPPIVTAGPGPMGRLAVSCGRRDDLTACGRDNPTAHLPALHTPSTVCLPNRVQTGKVSGFGGGMAGVAILVMATTERGTVIVGASLAGAKAAEALREAGDDGPVVLLGEEPDPPYERPELSKGYLAGDKSRDDLAVLADGWYAEHDVELRLGTRAVAVHRQDRQVELAGGERLGYDRLLLATGSSPVKLKVPGNDLDGVLYLRRVGHSDAIKEAIAAGGPLVVIGGGWIGLEVAAVARQRGLEVTLVEQAPVPLARVLGDTVGAHLADLHRAHGVDLRLGSGVAALVGDGTVEGVRLGDGSTVPAAAVVVGVGIRPRTELAVDAGLAVDDGILVDAGLRTDDEAVWAAGDVANAQNDWVGHRLRVEHYANASDQGPFAGRSMAGLPGRWAMPPFFWSDQYDAGMEYRGWADPAKDRLVLRGSPGDGPWTAFWLDGDRVAAALHVNAWDDADAIKALVVERAVVDPDRLADPQVGWDQVPAVGSST
jgi:3-phenylpropionate/trans-cinnamate dioxygenase ferredoxin reductase component